MIRRRRPLVALLVCLLTLATAVPVAGPVHGHERTQEIPNTAILGVEELEASTHAETFSPLLYVDDPIEPFNRASLRVTKAAVDWLLLPVAKGYRVVVPEPVRRSLDRMGYNLTYPGRLVSLLLQGELRRSAAESAHFATNTTLGVAGLFDPAGRFGVPTYAEDVGQAFARWGIGPGFYLFIPFLGPSSGRDAVGRVVDTALHPLLWAPVPGLSAVFSVNAFSFRIDGYEALVAAFADPYFPARALWSVQRQIEVEDYEIPVRAYETADPEPSLGLLRLALADPAFPRRARTRAVTVPATGRRLPYSLWLQAGSAPVVFIVPGVGAHRLATLPVALAEMAVARGCSAVVVSSPFHPEFLRNALTVDYPGHTPSDAEDVYWALSGIWTDLRAGYGDRIGPPRLLGYSLGGTEALFIAARQADRAPGALRFERVVAVNPPVDPLEAGRRFDAYFDAPLAWPLEARAERIRRLAMKAFLVTQDGAVADRLPFDRAESEFLVGLGGRATIAEALTAIEDRGLPGLAFRPMPDNGREETLLDTILQGSFTRYYEELAGPYFAARTGGDLGPGGLAEAAGLRGQAAQFAREPGVAIVTNADDFVLGTSGLAWLRAHAGARLTVFPSGGHLGNLHDRNVQDAIFAPLGAGPAGGH